MGNRIGLAYLLLVFSGFACGGLRYAPDLDGGGSGGTGGGLGGRGGGGGISGDGGVDGPICPAGSACTPSNLCHVGATTCGTAGPGCMDTQQPQANGTVCGQYMVCNNGSCVACAGGTACTVTGKPCRTGAITCDTGTAVCTEVNDQPNGTNCGTGMVCQAGQCAACQTGAACTPTNACHQGTLSCTTGTPQCTDAATNLPAGTACGTNRVCNAAGTCGDCTVGASCSVANRPCHTGTTTCNTGAPACVESGNVQNGTTCGTNMVCSGGACVSCTVGLVCTPPNPCHAGVTSCSPSITCADSGSNLVNGTVCGTNRVCSNGTCTACTAGASCQPTNPCRTGTTSCVTGTSVCSETGNRANGTSCGTNQVCNAGACVACTAGGTCTPSNPCHNGTLTCTTGTPVCSDNGTLVGDGRSCGTNLVCKTGSCVSCTAGVTCSPTNPCRLGRTSCSTGASVCVEVASKATGTLCGAAQSCADGMVTSAAMCDQNQDCVTTTTACPGACNAAGNDCAGSCGAGYLECANRNSCQVRSWGFEDGTNGGFRIVSSGPSAVKSIATSTAVSHSGTTALALAIDAKGSARRFEVGMTVCEGSFVQAMGQTVSAWFYLSPASASVPAPHPSSTAGEHLYTTAGEGGNTTSPLPVGSWFRVQTPIASVGMRLESFSLEGLFDTDGTTASDWSGTVYVDDIVIQ